jgi:S-adenosylmethionine:tRNA ribosyltransferase-isomerase
MIAATAPVQRPGDARLLTVDAFGAIRHVPRSRLPGLLKPCDVVIANDAATIPASLRGTHAPSGREVEVRLAARASLLPAAIGDAVAVVFGEGDFRSRTEDRPQPPALHRGDRLLLGPLIATIVSRINHPRLVLLHFDGTPDDIWAGLARHGRPVQYSHLSAPLAIWDSWTPIAGPPVAFEPPSASFALSWSVLESLAERRIGFATITHAAGLSSTGDAALDAMLPFDEAYSIPRPTARLINRARARGSRIVAIGTSVVRALEHAADDDGRVREGDGLATGRLGAGSNLRVVDALLTGTHEPGTSHHDLLRAFVDDGTLDAVDAELDRCVYRTHEFGDSMLLEKGWMISSRVAAVGAPQHELSHAIAG